MKKYYSLLKLEDVQKLPNITLSESNDSIMQEKIKYRRKTVNQFRLRGYTNQQIAEKIGASLSTIEKDLEAIRENVRQWFEEDAITEYCQSIYDGITLCDNILEELDVLYLDESDGEMKIKILSLISIYEHKKQQLYEETMAVRRYLGRNYDK